MLELGTSISKCPDLDECHREILLTGRVLRRDGAALMVRSTWSGYCVLLKCLDEKRWLLASILGFDGFTLLATLLNDLILGQLWYRLDIGIHRRFLISDT
jgi:hypothetical protein